MVVCSHAFRLNSLLIALHLTQISQIAADCTNDPHCMTCAAPDICAQCMTGYNVLVGEQCTGNTHGAYINTQDIKVLEPVCSDVVKRHGNLNFFKFNLLVVIQTRLYKSFNSVWQWYQIYKFKKTNEYGTVILLTMWILFNKSYPMQQQLKYVVWFQPRAPVFNFAKPAQVRECVLNVNKDTC